MRRRTIFIGDVHGCSAELDELVGTLAPKPGDRLIFLGDLVDRGPDSLGVVDRVEALLDRFPGSAAIAGNHEDNAMRDRERGETRRAWAQDATDDHWAFLASLPLVWRSRELGVLAVHGGVYPRFFALHGALGDVSPTWRTDRGKRADRLRRFLRVRRVSTEGLPVPLDDVTSHACHWTELYYGQEGFCFFGHDPQVAPAEPLRAPFATGLDTGCCFGGYLTAAVLAAGVAPRDAEFVRVAARARYAEPRESAAERERRVA